MSFPHPLYSKYVLEPAFIEAKDYFYLPMLQANRAHVIMLYECEIISKENAASLLQGLNIIEEEGLEVRQYQPGIEDLFFSIENRLIELVGEKHGGNLQLARSRNDLGYALTRIAIRRELTLIGESLLSFRISILDMAEENINTIMPGYTHTQPAQPTTFGHYLTGVAESLERFFEKFKLVYSQNNLSPLGAAALTGTGFDVDRKRSAELLGFNDIILSTQDSIGAGDNLTDVAGLLAGLGVFLSRMTKDFIFWCTKESGAIQIDDSFIQVSSIMPQKRNPVVIEHLRARISRMIGLSEMIFLQCHNIPYGDTQDVEDEIVFAITNLTKTARDILDLYSAVVQTMTINRQMLKRKAKEAFITVTELADTLVRNGDFPFRQAHHLVSKLVEYGVENNCSIEEIPFERIQIIAKDVIGEELDISETEFYSALDVEYFIHSRNGIGGVSPQSTLSAIKIGKNKLKSDRDWLSSQKATLDQARKEIRKQECQILNSKD